MVGEKVPLESRKNKPYSELSLGVSDYPVNNPAQQRFLPGG
jgi:hypothetical protein